MAADLDGGTRFFCAGLLLLGVLRVTTWFGEYVVPSRELSRALWLRGGLESGGLHRGV